VGPFLFINVERSKFKVPEHAQKTNAQAEMALEGMDGLELLVLNYYSLEMLTYFTVIWSFYLVISLFSYYCLLIIVSLQSVLVYLAGRIFTFL
jgi:hypothetical protein